MCVFRFNVLAHFKPPCEITTQPHPDIKPRSSSHNRAPCRARSLAYCTSTPSFSLGLSKSANTTNSTANSTGGGCAPSSPSAKPLLTAKMKAGRDAPAVGDL